MSHKTIKPLAKNQEKYDRVRSLRRSGMSQKDIAKTIGIYHRQVSDWTWDIILTDEQKKNLKIQQNKKNSDHKKQNTGVKNGNYRGDNAGYDAIHKWIYKNKPKPDECEYCSAINMRLVCACVGEYKRDINQFKWLCWSCQCKDDRKKSKTPTTILSRKI